MFRRACRAVATPLLFAATLPAHESLRFKSTRKRKGETRDTDHAATSPNSLVWTGEEESTEVASDSLLKPTVVASTTDKTKGMAIFNKISQIPTGQRLSSAWTSVSFAPHLSFRCELNIPEGASFGQRVMSGGSNRLMRESGGIEVQYNVETDQLALGFSTTPKGGWNYRLPDAEVVLASTFDQSLSDYNGDHRKAITFNLLVKGVPPAIRPPSTWKASEEKSSPQSPRSSAEDSLDQDQFSIGMRKTHAPPFHPRWQVGGRNTLSLKLNLVEISRKTGQQIYRMGSKTYWSVSVFKKCKFYYFLNLDPDLPDFGFDSQMLEAIKSQMPEGCDVRYDCEQHELYLLFPRRVMNSDVESSFDHPLADLQVSRNTTRFAFSMIPNSVTQDPPKRRSHALQPLHTRDVAFKPDSQTSGVTEEQSQSTSISTSQVTPQKRKPKQIGKRKSMFTKRSSSAHVMETEQISDANSLRNPFEQNCGLVEFSYDKDEIEKKSSAGSDDKQEELEAAASELITTKKTPKIPLRRAAPRRSLSTDDHEVESFNATISKKGLADKLVDRSAKKSSTTESSIDKIRKIYTKHAPHKLDDVQEIVAYYGAEDALQMIEQKYLI